MPRSVLFAKQAEIRPQVDYYQTVTSYVFETNATKPDIQPTSTSTRQRFSFRKFFSNIRKRFFHRNPSSVEKAHIAIQTDFAMATAVATQTEITSVSTATQTENSHVNTATQTEISPVSTATQTQYSPVSTVTQTEFSPASQYWVNPVDMIAYNMAKRAWQDFVADFEGKSSALVKCYPPRKIDGESFREFNDEMEEMAIKIFQQCVMIVENKFSSTKF